MMISPMKYSRLPTEQRNPRTMDLDRIPLLAAVRKINREDRAVPVAVGRESVHIAKAAKLASGCYLAGGKIIFIGAGTSGRLGVLEAAECPPTFGVSPDRVVAIMAGGPEAVFRSKEGAEDDGAAGTKDIRRVMTGKDCVIGIAASGVTPYVLAALKTARAAGCKTVFVTCNKKPFKLDVDVKVAIGTGPESLTGSTRMKAGTGTKLALNCITTGAMIAMGKVYTNLMVDVVPSNLKLRNRAQRLVSTLTGLSAEKAAALLSRTGYEVKTSVVMHKLGVSAAQARKLLQSSGGFLREVIG